MSRFTLAGLAAIPLVACGGALPAADSGLPPPGEPIEIVGPNEFMDPGRLSGSISEIALSEDYVNFTVPRYGVYRIPKYGGQKVAIRTDSNVVFHDVAATRDTVVWTEAAFATDLTPLPVKVMRQSQSGGEAPVALVNTTLVQSEEYVYVSRVQISADIVYMFGRQEGAELGIYAVPLAGGSTRLVVALPDIVPGAPTWRVAGGYVYYLSGAFQSADCLLRRVSVANGAAEDLAACPPFDATYRTWIGGVDDTDVFLIAHSAIWKAPTQGGPATAVFTASDPEAVIIPYGMTVDAQKLYFVLKPAGGSDTLVSIAKVGGAMTTIGAAPPFEDAGDDQLLQDASTLFLRSGGTRITILPKVPVAP